MDSFSPLAFPSFPPSDPNEPVRQVGVRVNDQGITEAFQTVTPPKPFNYEDLTPDQRDALQGAVYAANLGTQQDIEAHREVVLGFGASLPNVMSDKDATAAALFTLGFDPAKPGPDKAAQVTMVRQLNQEGKGLQEDFKARYGDTSCSCHSCPPCGYCTHPGNPLCLDEDDSMWEVVPVQVVPALTSSRVFLPGPMIGGAEGLGGVPQETLNEIMERNPLGFKGEKHQVTETQRTGPASNTISWSKFKAPSHQSVMDDLKAATVKHFGAPGSEEPWSTPLLSGSLSLTKRIQELEAQNAELMLALQKAQRTFLLLDEKKCLRSRDADGTESTTPPSCVLGAVIAIARALHDKVPTRTLKALEAIDWLEREAKYRPNVQMDWSLDDEAWVITIGGRSWTCDEEMGGIIGAVESIKNRSVDPSAKSWPFEEFKREFDETVGKMTAEELEAAMDEIRAKEGATGEAPEMVQKHWEEAGEA